MLVKDAKEMCTEDFIKRIKRLEVGKPHPLCRDDRGRTLWLWVALYVDVSTGEQADGLVDAMFAKGHRHLRALDHDGRTPLTLAASVNNSMLLEAMLQMARALGDDLNLVP